MTDKIDDGFTEDGLRALLGDLLDGWRNDRGRGQGFESAGEPATVSTVYALTAHAYKLGYAVLALLGDGFAVETIPLIRSAYEATITASWIGQIPDALPAYLNRNHNQQKALRDTMTAAGWADGSPAIPADALTPYLVSKHSKDGASYVQTLCKDFFTGDAMYSVYRGLSWLTHPTAAVTDMYLEMKPTAVRPTLHTTARYANDLMTTWLHVLCASLVWSARALNLIDATRTKSGDRQRLRIAARTLGITEFLAVTNDAKFRGSKHERVRAAAPDAD
ncbi:MAG: DUF5677 domain-containing protein [Jatrophihabitans sp.]